MSKLLTAAIRSATEPVVGLLNAVDTDAAAAMLELRKQARDALVGRVLKQAVFGRARGLASSTVCSSLDGLSKRLQKVEDGMGDRMKAVMGGGGGLRTAMLKSVLKTTLNKATQYEVSVGGVAGSLDMMRLAWQRERSQLTKDENELSYLLDKLTKMEELTVTRDSWKDVSESWQALLSLRSQIAVERGQQLLEVICTDEMVLKAIGAVHQLKDVGGEVPTAVLAMLNQGPSAHIRSHAYKYRKLLDRELTRVRRVKELQARIIGAIGSLFLATMISTGNVIGRLYYDLLQADQTSASVAASAVVVSVLLCCTCLLVCRRASRPRLADRAVP